MYTKVFTNLYTCEQLCVRYSKLFTVFCNCKQLSVCNLTRMRHSWRWKGFCTTWLAGAPSQREQKFILRSCLQNLFDTISIQSFTDPYQKWKDPKNVVGVAEVHPHHILGPKAMTPFIFGRGLQISVWNVMPCGKPHRFCIINCINILKTLWFHDKMLIRFFWRGW